MIVGQSHIFINNSQKPCIKGRASFIFRIQLCYKDKAHASFHAQSRWIMNIVAVGIGGIIGAISRYILVIIVSNHWFPYHTLLCNLIGCFILGWFLTLATTRWKVNASIRLLIATGAIGSFTTFSSFSIEVLQLLQSGHYPAALGYILFTIIGGIILSFTGYKLAKLMSQSKRVING